MTTDKINPEDIIREENHRGNVIDHLGTCLVIKTTDYTDSEKKEQSILQNQEIVERLNKKIIELETKGTSDIQEENHRLSPRAFLYYLKEIKGKYEPKQECPFDI